MPPSQPKKIYNNSECCNAKTVIQFGKGSYYRCSKCGQRCEVNDLPEEKTEIPSQPKDLPVPLKNVSKKELLRFEDEFERILDWQFWEYSTPLEKSRWYRALKNYFE